MIRIFVKYGIEPSERCFAVGKIGKAKHTDKKTNVVTEEECIQNPAYCTTLESALKYIRKSILMEELRNYDGDLQGAIEAIQALDAKFDEIVSKINF